MNTGETLAHYTIIRALGRGSMGGAYLAQDTKLKREVAIKILPEAVQDDADRLNRLGLRRMSAINGHPARCSCIPTWLVTRRQRCELYIHCAGKVAPPESQKTIGDLPPGRVI